jgi:RNA polymerase sigma-70 factor, ECF subfamily
VLVTAARQGDREALEALLRRHQDRLHGLCRRMLGNDHDAEDATQEAMIAIVRGLARFDGRSAFSTWAYRVATNAALDELRRKGRRPRPTTGEDYESAFPADCPLDPQEAISARLDVDAALQLLPEDQRAAVVLRDLLDLDYAEIAEVLAIPIGTVRSRIARGRGAIASLLSPGHAGAGAERVPASDEGNLPSPSERQKKQEP